MQIKALTLALEQLISKRTLLRDVNKIDEVRTLDKQIEEIESAINHITKIQELSRSESKDKPATATGIEGFAFERRVTLIFDMLQKSLGPTWQVKVFTEQGIRDFFKEHSLNGVDHLVMIESPEKVQRLFLIQEKWKLVTNQREVSQFLDCCARILARLPEYKGAIHRIWASRTVPSQNGEKSLKEGQCIVVQTCTSQTLLALNLLFTVCDILGRRDCAVEIFSGIGSVLPSAEEALPDPESVPATFEPVSDFGEKRVMPITNKTVVMVNKIV